ncbi:hypothetical protein HYY75_05175 [bacterium]|nr:hypothetical protein [bacterium]
MVSLLKVIRHRLSSALAKLSVEQASSKNPESAPQKNSSKVSIALTGVASLPPYELLGKIKQGWPPFEPIPGRRWSKISEKALSNALDVTSSNREILRGRWLLATFTPSGLGKTIVRLLAAGVKCDDLEKIDRFLASEPEPSNDGSGDELGSGD